MLCLFYGIWQTNFENAINWGTDCTEQYMKPFFSQQIWKIVFQVENRPRMVDSTAVQRCTCNGCEIADCFPSLFPPRLCGYSVALTPTGFWTNRLQAVYSKTGERKRWLSWNLSVQYLVPGWDYHNEECAVFLILETTHSSSSLNPTQPGVCPHH